MANEFIIKNGFRSQGNSEITGSISVAGTAGITSTITANSFIASNNGSSFMVGGTNMMDYGDGLRIAYSGGSQKITIFTNSGTPRFQIVNNGNVQIGTTTDSGYLLDVNGTAIIRGQLNVPALTASGTATFQSTVNYTTLVNLYARNNNFYISNFVPSGGTISGITLSPSSGTFTNVGAGGTSRGDLFVSATDIATSVGNVTLNHFVVQNTINNTAATSLIRGFYYNPTLTSMVGTTHYAFHSTSGDIIFGGNARVAVTGSLSITGSAGTGSAIYAYKSGSTVLDIQGSQGQLFSVIDALSGSLMSVNDVSGLPILEVFSDDRVVMGTYGAPALTVSGSAVTVATASVAPTGTVPEGTFRFATVGGAYYIYAYLGGAWRSGSLF